MLLRAFKHDDDFEMWASSKPDEPLSLIGSYPICKKSGVLGPKRRWGDRQVPEGFYHIHRFNAWSGYHMSLRVDYPNASDRVRGKKGALGGAIMVHGDCVTIGCIPLQDDPIEEVFIAVLDTHRKSRRRVPIHIYPTRLDDDGIDMLRERAAGDATRLAFWTELVPAYRHFEATKTIPIVAVDPVTGAYTVTNLDPSVM
jgi:murein L,D-transpeptidase YafK